MYVGTYVDFFRSASSGVTAVGAFRFLVGEAKLSMPCFRFFVLGGGVKAAVDVDVGAGGSVASASSKRRRFVPLLVFFLFVFGLIPDSS